MTKYVQYSININLSVEEPLEDIVYDPSSEEWDEESVREYIMQERWDFLADSICNEDWDIDVRLVDRDD